tara:strand:+ start:382 stop:537 length:156 start_codon:yes stop_codon:yes gene_type:complete
MNKNGFLIIMVFLFGIFNAQETISELEIKNKEFLKAISDLENERNNKVLEK